MREMLVFECEKCGTLLIEKSMKLISVNNEIVAKIWCEDCHKIHIRQKAILEEDADDGLLQ